MARFCGLFPHGVKKKIQITYHYKNNALNPKEQLSETYRFILYLLIKLFIMYCAVVLFGERSGYRVPVISLEAASQFKEVRRQSHTRMILLKKTSLRGSCPLCSKHKCWRAITIGP